jgi:hypothetical protein
MVMASSLIAIPIPRVSGRITVADTFVFLTLIALRRAAAILVPRSKGVAATFDSSAKSRARYFSTPRSSHVDVFYRRRHELDSLVRRRAPFNDGFRQRFFIRCCVMALVQYAQHEPHRDREGLQDQGIDVATWRTYYLWTSVTYFAGASAAGIIAILIKTYGFYAIVATAPIILIICFTYQTYLKNIEASLEQTEAARLHVEELSRTSASCNVRKKRAALLCVPNARAPRRKRRIESRTSFSPRSRTSCERR